MENDSIYKRLNIYSIMKLVKERNPDMEEYDVRCLSYKIISELNKKIDEVASEFESGDGYFDACYFSAKDNLNL